jgi:hypothetical protein
MTPLPSLISSSKFLRGTRIETAIAEIADLNERIAGMERDREAERQRQRGQEQQKIKTELQELGENFLCFIFSKFLCNIPTDQDSLLTSERWSWHCFFICRPSYTYSYVKGTRSLDRF